NKFFGDFLKKTIFEVDEEKIINWIDEEYRKLYSEGIYAHSIPRRMKVEEISKNLLPLLKAFVRDKKVINLKQRSISVSEGYLEEESEKKFSGSKIELISEKILSLEKEFTAQYGKYSFVARVDRIDEVSALVNKNSETNGKANDFLDDGSDEGEGYAILDYKYADIRNSAIEQLMFYDWILQKSNDSAINTGDRVYFILFSLKPDDKGKYTYGYEYAKRQNDNDSPKIFLPIGKRGKISGYTTFDYQVFENWLMELISMITEKGSFIPVFLESDMKSFVKLAMRLVNEKGMELIAPNGSKETRNCRSASNRAYNCPYEPICSMFEIHGVKLKKS
ncbi:MAG: hypothetical protein P3W91_007015, partial [Fervidobacterium sp.]|nr:hypothetical protein [Fervidobacterium sp.]